MQVKVTMPMYKAIRSHIAERFPGYSVTLEKLSAETFRRYVDMDIYRHEIDYSAKTGKFSVLRIKYPDEFYAMPSYLTTADLSWLFRSSDRTWESFLKQIEREIKI